MAIIVGLLSLATFVAGSQAQQATWDGTVEVSVSTISIAPGQTVTYSVRLSKPPAVNGEPFPEGEEWFVMLYVNREKHIDGIHGDLTVIPSFYRTFDDGDWNQWKDFRITRKVDCDDDDDDGDDCTRLVNPMFSHEVWDHTANCPVHNVGIVTVATPGINPPPPDDPGNNDPDDNGGNGNGNGNGGGNTGGGNTGGGNTGGGNTGGGNTGGGNTGGGNTGGGNTGGGNTGGGNTGGNTEGKDDGTGTEGKDDGTGTEGKDDGTGTGGDTGTGDTTPPPVVPGAPKLSATPGDGSVRLRWLPPDDDGGSPIARYEYQQTVGGGSFGVWTDIPDSAPGGANTSAVTVTGLSNGSVYTFRVRAVNGVGPGQASNPASATPTELAALKLSWLARFGRTVADHALDTIDERIAASSLTATQTLPAGPAANLGPLAPGTFAGAYAFGASGPAEAFPATPGAQDGLPSAFQDLSTRKFLLGNSFRFSVFDEEAFAGAQWTVWGRAATGQFAGGAAGISLDGDVTTGLIGADMERGRMRAGVAMSHSLGEGAVDEGASTGVRTDVEATLTSLYPYARYAVREDLSVWAVLGFGQGRYARTGSANGRAAETDLGMKLGALGARGALLSEDETGSINVAVKSDAFWVHVEADPREWLATTSVEAMRLRLALEGWRETPVYTGGVLRQSVELALRHDGGDAEEGTGLELGGRLRYTDPARGFAIEAMGQGLLAHEDSSYRDWGAGVSFQYDPCVFCLPGFGLSMRVAPSWGSAPGRAGRLWSRQTVGDLAADEGSAPGGRLDAEVSYGMAAPGHQGLLAPYAGLSLTDGDARTLRLGGRLRLRESRLAFNVEGAHHDRADGTQEQRLLLNVFVY